MYVSPGIISCFRDPDRSRLGGLHHPHQKHLLNAQSYAETYWASCCMKLVESTGQGAPSRTWIPPWTTSLRGGPLDTEKTSHRTLEDNVLSGVGMWGCLASLIPLLPLTNRPFTVF